MAETMTLVNGKMRGVIRLTRWQEYLPFVIPVTLLGALLAVRSQNRILDWRLAIVLLANVLAVGYAFMINDIEDAPDDAREAHRAARNPVACGEITPRQGWLASGGVALIALVLYALSGAWPFVIGLLTLALCHLYSWKPIRLKAWPVTDILSHSLMLSGLLFLTGYFAYDQAPGPVWLVALAATLLSVYGQLYNQLRDFEMDKAAGLNNTAIIVGKRNAQWMMYGVVVIALLLMIYALLMDVIPLWIVAVPLISILALTLWARHSANPEAQARDMRGTVTTDVSGAAQAKFMLVANLTLVVWLFAALFHLA